MEAFQRSQVKTLQERLAENPHHIIAVFGPRQSGKTTLVRQALRRIDRPIRYFLLDTLDAGAAGPSDSAAAVGLPREPDTEWLVRTWQEAREEADANPKGLVLVLDEIQTIPRWSSTVKGLWDADRFENRQMHVVILGSAPLRVQSGLTESLAGRFEPIRVPHWSLDEMADAFNFDLDEYIYFGGYPGGAQFIRDEERWRAYILNAIVAPNVRKDILAMTRVDKPALLTQLFELGAEFSGQILTYNKMLGSLQDAGNATTLARYLELLSTADLVTGIPKYAGSVLRVRRSSPKLNVLNTALMSAASTYSFEQARADRTFWGRLVESAVGAHIINTTPSNLRVHYWRESTDEVDFVLGAARRVVAIEVKSGRTARRQPGLEAFARRFQTAHRMLVGEGGTAVEEFLTKPADYWFRQP